jgi:hypothetical protein
LKSRFFLICSFSCLLMEGAGSVLIIADPDPGGPKTYRYGSRAGSGTLEDDSFTHEKICAVSCFPRLQRLCSGLDKFFDLGWQGRHKNKRKVRAFKILDSVLQNAYRTLYYDLIALLSRHF